MKFNQLLKNILNCYQRKAKLKFKPDDKLAWSIIGKDVKLKEFEKKYNRYHSVYKYKFLKPILFIGVYIFSKINKTVQGKSHTRPKDIDKDDYNRILNSWNESLHQTCKEICLLKKNKDIDGYYNPDKLYFNKFIKLLNNVFMTNILYDTFHRTLFELFVVNLTNNINDKFKHDNKHIIYDSKQVDSIEFLKVVNRNDGDHLVLRTDDGSYLIVKKEDIIKISNAKLKPEDTKQNKR